jgi:uracil-DNA glycosylase
VLPPPRKIFSAFNLCPFDKVSVVIMGQDPYHGVNQANGMSFSVNKDMAVPPSLKNIFKEINSDLKIQTYQNGDLTRWAVQGVLLLNAILTVNEGMPASHKNIGWEKFTDAVIDRLNIKRNKIVYILWGNYAKEKGKQINRVNNLVLESAHPSPFSAQKFFNIHHFSKCNAYLVKNNKREIDWR